MKTLSPLLLLPLLSFADELPPDWDCRMDALEEQIRCCFGNPSRPFCDESYGVEIAGDFIYFQAFEEGLAYAIRNDFNQAIAGIPESAGGPMIDPKPRWQPGFRIALGYAPSFTLRTAWLRLHSSGINHAYAASSNVNLEGVLIPSNPDLTQYQFAKLNWQLALDAVDFELGKRYFVSASLAFEPDLSVRLAIIDQSFHAVYGPRLIPLLINEEVHAMNDFRGVGPRAALRSNWGFAENWELFATGAASLLYGQFKTNYSYQLPDGEADRISEECHHLAPVGEIALGIGWGRSVSRDRIYLGLRLGYEGYLFWDQNELRQTVDSAAPALSFKQGRDLSLHGFSLSGLLEF